MQNTICQPTLLRVRPYLGLGSLCLMLMGAGTPPAAVAGNAPRVKETLELPCQPGNAYTLQWRQGNQNWTQGEKIYFPTETTLKIESPSGISAVTHEFDLTPANAEAGAAPRKVKKQEIRLVNALGASSTLCFLTESSAILSQGDNRWTVNYTYQKTDSGAGKISFQCRGATETWSLDFAQPEVGHAKVSRVFENGLTDTYETAFYYGPPPARTFEDNAVLPTSPDGLRFGLFENGQLKVVSFTTTEMTITTASGAIVQPPIGYNYELLSPTEAVITQVSNQAGNGEGTSQTFHFNIQGDGTGTFSRDPGNGNIPTDGGMVQPQPRSPTTTPAPCDSPDSLTGRKLKLTGALSSPQSLNFGEDTGFGQKEKSGNVEICPFNYLYNRVDNNTGRVRTSTPTVDGDQVDEIDMNFNGEDDCAGTFSRRTYQNGSLTGVTNGTFGPG